jgi:hypothetical protein
MNLPQSTDTLDAAYLDSLLRSRYRDPGQEVAHFSVHRLEKGTSGAQLYSVSVGLASGIGPLRFVLKLNGGHKEVCFYRDLASRLPVDTPYVLDARLLDDGRAWLLMEEITDVKDGLTWDEADYRVVLYDVAQLHAQFWSRTSLLDDCPWLWRPDDAALQELVAARKSDLDAISTSWLPDALPEVFASDRLSLAMRVLEQPNTVFGPLLAAGTTLVHGDYWFHNVQITTAGRRVLVDWQDAQVWSGLWELAYFLNLLLPVGPNAYRENLPVDEDLMINWYAEGLAEAGVALPKSTFDEALLAARVWHPLQHWFRQLGQAVTQGGLTPRTIQDENPGAVRFLITTFARWDQDAHTLLGV